MFVRLGTRPVLGRIQKSGTSMGESGTSSGDTKESLGSSFLDLSGL